MSQMAVGQVAPSQGGTQPRGAAGVEATISENRLTFKNHQINAGASAGNLEGESCPASFKMIAGSCHPSYNDQIPIINQFPNISLNTGVRIQE
jgi:hypothetical protein